MSRDLFARLCRQLILTTTTVDAWDPLPPTCRRTSRLRKEIHLPGPHSWQEPMQVSHSLSLGMKVPMLSAQPTCGKQGLLLQLPRDRSSAQISTSLLGGYFCLWSPYINLFTHFFLSLWTMGIYFRVKNSSFSFLLLQFGLSWVALTHFDILPPMWCFLTFVVGAAAIC